MFGLFFAIALLAPASGLVGGNDVVPQQAAASPTDDVNELKAFIMEERKELSDVQETMTLVNTPELQMARRGRVSRAAGENSRVMAATSARKCPEGFDAAPHNVSTSKCFKLTYHCYNSPSQCDCGTNASAACPANAAELNLLINRFGTDGWLGLYWAPDAWSEPIMLNKSTFMQTYQPKCVATAAAAPSQIVPWMRIILNYINDAFPFPELCTSVSTGGWIEPRRCADVWSSTCKPCICEYPTSGPASSGLADLHQLASREDTLLWKLNAASLTGLLLLIVLPPLLACVLYPLATKCKWVGRIRDTVASGWTPSTSPLLWGLQRHSTDRATVEESQSTFPIVATSCSCSCRDSTDDNDSSSLGAVMEAEVRGDVKRRWRRVRNAVIVQARLRRLCRDASPSSSFTSADSMSGTPTPSGSFADRPQPSCPSSPELNAVSCSSSPVLNSVALADALAERAPLRSRRRRPWARQLSKRFGSLLAGSLLSGDHAQDAVASMAHLRSATLAAAQIRLRVTGICLCVGWICTMWSLGFSNYYGLIRLEPPAAFGNMITHDVLMPPGLCCLMLAILPTDRRAIRLSSVCLAIFWIYHIVSNATTGRDLIRILTHTDIYQKAERESEYTLKAQLVGAVYFAALMPLTGFICLIHLSPTLLFAPRRCVMAPRESLLRQWRGVRLFLFLNPIAVVAYLVPVCTIGGHYCAQCALNIYRLLGPPPSLLLHTVRAPRGWFVRAHALQTRRAATFGPTFS